MTEVSTAAVVEGDLCHLCSPVPLPTVRSTLLTHSKPFEETASVPDRADIRGPRQSVQFLRNESLVTNRSMSGIFPGTVHQRKGNIMIGKIALAVIASTAFGGAFAQTSNINLNNATQTQSGNGSSQIGDIGNNNGKGSSNVTMHDFTQTQSGNTSGQGAWIGTTWWGSTGTSNVTANDVTQTQSGGNGAYQGMDVGYAWGSGTSNVTLHDIKQTQSGSGANTTQYMAIGNAGNGTSKVKMNDVNQSQSGNGSYQALWI